jgi:hypothetical protein
MTRLSISRGFLLPRPRSDRDHEHLVQMGLRFEGEAAIRVGRRRRVITIAAQTAIVDERGLGRASIVSSSPPVLSSIPDVGVALAWEGLSEGMPLVVGTLR